MTGELLDIELLKKFSPLNGLKRDNLAALAKKVQIRELSPQQLLFKEGDTEKRTIYIISGALELLDQGNLSEVIEGGTDGARNPVSPLFPRQVTARAHDRVQYISIDSDLLDVMLTWDQTGCYEVSELHGDDPRRRIFRPVRVRSAIASDSRMDKCASGVRSIRASSASTTSTACRSKISAARSGLRCARP